MEIIAMEEAHPVPTPPMCALSYVHVVMTCREAAERAAAEAKAKEDAHKAAQAARAQVRCTLTGAGYMP